MRNSRPGRHEALQAGDGSARFLRRYQAAWRAALGPEIRVAALFRTFASRLSDAELDEAFQLLGRDPAARLIREHAAFNWHKPLILALWRSAPIRRFIWHAVRETARPTRHASMARFTRPFLAPSAQNVTDATPVC